MTTDHRAASAAPPETLDDDPRIGGLMTPRVVAITPDSPLRTALGLMAGHDVRHLPVLAGTRCLGVVGETDLVHAVAVGGPPLVGPLARPVHALPATARRSEAARAMLAAGTDAVLVAEHGRIVGIVTATDLLVSLADLADPADPADPA
jgi:CBS domain-containing protein